MNIYEYWTCNRLYQIRIYVIDNRMLRSIIQSLLFFYQTFHHKRYIIYSKCIGIFWFRKTKLYTCHLTTRKFFKMCISKTKNLCICSIFFLYFCCDLGETFLSRTLFFSFSYSLEACHQNPTLIGLTLSRTCTPSYVVFLNKSIVYLYQSKTKKSGLSLNYLVTRLQSGMVKKHRRRSRKEEKYQ